MINPRKFTAPRVTALALLLAGLPGISCKKDATAGAEPAASAAAQAGRGKRGAGGVAMAVDVMPVVSKTVDYVVTAPGTLDAFERVEVTARVAGAVDKRRPASTRCR